MRQGAASAGGRTKGKGAGVAGHGHETHRGQHAAPETAVALFQEDQFLPVYASTGATRRPPSLKLIHQGRRDHLRRAGDGDAPSKGGLRPAGMTVADAHADVRRAEFRGRLARSARGGRISIHKHLWTSSASTAAW